MAITPPKGGEVQAWANDPNGVPFGIVHTAGVPHVIVDSSGLPDGAATAALQTALNNLVATAALQTILNTATGSTTDAAAGINAAGSIIAQLRELTTPKDIRLEVPCGNISGQKSVNKFGRSTNVDNATNTDIWDRANATNDQAIWLAPTAARIHTIDSNSIQDDTGGTGANSVTVSYLPDWDTAETTETVTGDLNTGIPMNNAAVMIHRMKVTPQATSTSPNVGTITATAASDGTVTAQINPGEGQTQMAIYGIPSTQTAYLTGFYTSALLQSQGATTRFIDSRMLFNPNPDTQVLAFLVKHSLGMVTTGSSTTQHLYNPYNKFTGPGIFKLQASASVNDMDISGGFDLILVDN